MRKILAILACVLAFAATPTQEATAQLSIAQTEIARPSFDGEIPLRSRARGRTQAEQWWSGDGGRSVRNVSEATLIPVLPAAENATGAAVIVAPGGAFQFLVMDNEGLAIARWLADNGIAAFVLKYRTDPTPRDASGFTAALLERLRGVLAGDGRMDATQAAREDGEAAIRLVRARAGAWNIDPNRIGFMGFSAGAITTIAVGLTDDAEARPNFIAPIYGSMASREVGADAPPMFVAIALDDGFFARNRDLALIESWRAAGRPVEAHLYERGDHGFAPTSAGAASLWKQQFLAWLHDRGVLTAQ